MTIENINNNERKYLLQIFRARLDKSENKFCACKSNMAETYYLKKNRKLLYCSVCLRKISPISDTLFANSKIRIETLLKIANEVISKGDDIVPKALWYDYDLSIPSAYRTLKKIQHWEKNDLKKLHKKPIKRIDRTERDVLKLILRTLPPLNNNNQKVNL